ncbi:hypothetical protein DNK10_18805 [Pseudomonas daroniae]|nr:hypothetical protein DNK10_18805 [Pseudomonas daroniae]
MFDKYPSLLEMTFILVGVALFLVLPFFMYALIRLGLSRNSGPVNSRAPGLSEHDSPFGQTEARAERTIERPPDKPASARECGAASLPRAPEPSAARVG